MNRVAPHVAHERDAEIEEWENLVRWRTLLSADRTPTMSMTVGTAEIAPGASHDGARHHHADHESYYVIAGTGLVYLDDVEHPVEAGSVVFIPGGTRHFLRNTGAETMKVVFLFPVDQFGDVEYRFEG